MKNQILLVGAPRTNKLTILKEIFKINDLSNHIPEDCENHSGIIINGVNINTKYYDTEIGVFLDEFKDGDKGSRRIWIDEFKSDDMRELRDYLQGLIITVDLNSDLLDIKGLSDELERISDQLDEEYLELAKNEDDFQWTGFKVVVGVNKDGYEIDPDKLAEIEDYIVGSGFEFVNYGESSGKTETGDTYGKERLIEIIENNEWKDLNLLKNKLEKSEEELNKLKSEKTSDLLESLLKLEQNEQEETDEFYDGKDISTSIDDMQRLVNKLKQAKIDVSKISDDPNDERKEKYVNDLLQDLMRYM